MKKFIIIIVVLVIAAAAYRKLAQAVEAKGYEYGDKPLSHISPWMTSWPFANAFEKGQKRYKREQLD
jgi:hypothetical protein